MWIALKVASPAFVLPRYCEALLKCRWAPQPGGLAEVGKRSRREGELFLA